MTEKNPEPIRVHLAEGETGWVVPLNEQLCLIRNIPYTGSYNLGDVVELRPPDQPGGIPHLGAVIYRQYARRSTFYYTSPGQFYQMLSVLALFDAHVEDAPPVNLASPHRMAMVAHHDDLQVDKIAALVGLESRTSDLSRELES